MIRYCTYCEKKILNGEDWVRRRAIYSAPGVWRSRTADFHTECWKIAEGICKALGIKDIYDHTPIRDWSRRKEGEIKCSLE